MRSSVAVTASDNHSQGYAAHTAPEFPSRNSAVLALCFDECGEGRITHHDDGHEYEADYH